MIQLKPYEFTCPFCNESKVTFITDDKFAEVRSREKLIQEIFNPQYFNAAYREIFVSRICSKCQVDTFGSNGKNEMFDVNENEKTDELEARISDMYENARE